MKLEDVLSSLNLTDAEDAIRPEWELSQQSLPSGGLDFLDPDFIRKAAHDADLRADAGEAGAAAARRIAETPALIRLIWHFHYRLYHSRTARWDEAGSWPTLEASLGDSAGAFYLVLLLSNIPNLLELHRSHGVPAEVTRDTLLDMRHWLEEGGEEPGRDVWTCTPGNVAWLSFHTSGELYRLGRFQFQYAPSDLRIRVFRHRATQAVIALSEAGVRYLPNGNLDPTDGPADGPRAGAVDGWSSVLEVTEDEATGNPILPTGDARPKPVRLPFPDWRPVLKPGDPALHIHIPAGQPMSHHLCGESIRSAIDFFPRHFPEMPFVAFCCSSWILNTGLETLLPPTSNLVRFQREVYLVPTATGAGNVLRHVFGNLPDDLREAPRDTALQRAILDVLQSGRAIPTGGGGCFLFPEDFNWGQQVYRRQRLPLDLG